MLREVLKMKKHQNIQSDLYKIIRYISPNYTRSTFQMKTKDMISLFKTRLDSMDCEIIYARAKKGEKKHPTPPKKNPTKKRFRHSRGS